MNLSSEIEEELSIVPNKSRSICGETFVTVEFVLGFIGSANVIFLVLNIISSILQVYVLHRAYIHIRGRTADKCLHVFLFSATFADFLLTGIGYPIELSQKAHFIPMLPESVNVVFQLMIFISLITSSFSLVFMNLDKLLYFRFPLRYSQYFTRRRSVWISSVCWIASFGYIIFAWFNNSFICAPNSNCLGIMMPPAKVHIYIVFLLVTSVIPTITSLVVAFYILNIMTVHQRQIRQDELLCSPSHPHERQNSVFLIRMRTFYFIFFTTVFTAITLLPYRFVNIYRILNDKDHAECSSIVFIYILSYMVMLNSIINPLLTVTILPQYRLQWISRLHYKMQPSLREPESTRESI